LITEKARRIVKEKGYNLDLRFSNEWIEKLKKRHGIKQHVLHGEEGSVNLLEYENEKRNLQEILTKYDPKDVFN
jgi:hypothetical protein